MNIYSYDKYTKAYLYTGIADADPEATKLEGKFVPLLPAYSTLIAPPEYGEYQIPVFENGSWAIKADYRKNYKKVDDFFAVSVITTIGEITDGYLVSNEIAQEIMKNPMRFKISGNKIVKKTDEEYNAELNLKEKEEIAKLHMTKLDFYKYILKPNGIDYSTLLEILDSNEELQAAWDLCRDVYRGDEILNAYIGDFINITNAELDILFKKYGE